jgi:molybdate transport system substrate-binding protein
MMSRLIKITLVCMGLFLRPAWAGDVLVAVAANFAAPMQRIAAAFAQDTGHKAVLSIGSTGKLTSQVRHGAPFDVFLAADEKTPTKLVSEGLAQESSRFTYAIGQLVLWSPQTGLIDAHGAVLQQPLSGKLAVADPKLAPYGAAAFEVMDKKGWTERLRPTFVTGENIGQTFQFVKTGNAALGFVAFSQVMVDGKISAGSAWVIPSNLYSPIRQDAVLLKNGQSNAAAQALLQYLRGDAARAVIRAYGYQF